MKSIPELEAMRDELMAEGIMKFFNSMDFTPRWNKYDTVGFTVFCIVWFGMALGAALGY